MLGVRARLRRSAAAGGVGVTGGVAGVDGVVRFGWVAHRRYCARTMGVKATGPGTSPSLPRVPLRRRRGTECSRDWLRLIRSLRSSGGYARGFSVRPERRSVVQRRLAGYHQPSLYMKPLMSRPLSPALRRRSRCLRQRGMVRRSRSSGFAGAPFCDGYVFERRVDAPDGSVLRALEGASAHRGQDMDRRVAGDALDQALGLLVVVDEDRDARVDALALFCP